jgi:hypothetical protein
MEQQQQQQQHYNESVGGCVLVKDLLKNGGNLVSGGGGRNYMRFENLGIPFGFVLNNNNDNNNINNLKNKTNSILIENDVIPTNIYDALFEKVLVNKKHKTE